MQKIQKLVFIFLIIIGGLSLSTQNTHANSPERLLQSADSLFQQKKYTEALSFYQEVLDNGQESPSMLLKMAFITEGLNNHASALYYLNRYYLKTTDQTVLKKMAEMAEKHNLTGYSSSDKDIALTYYYRYFEQLVWVVYGACALLLLVVVRNKFIKNIKVPYAVGILIIVCSSALFYLVNYGNDYNKGIIVNPATYIMNGPGAGSGVMEIAGNGHRINIIGEEDVWLKILWKDDIGYIKNNHIRPLWTF